MSRRMRFDHLARMTTPLGLYEHASFDVPRIEHGFCVDDVARALVLTSREQYPSATVRRLTDVYLSFLLGAVHDDGRMHNRRAADGRWTDTPTTDDHWGRAIWALGVAATHLDDPGMRESAHVGATTALAARSPWPRARAYAALGAVELLRDHRRDDAAARLLDDLRHGLGQGDNATGWPWPQARLTYANAVLPEAMIAVGDHLGDDAMRDRGLTLLDWLVEEQTIHGRLSVVAGGGRSAGDPRAGHPQQPIEVATLAEACRTALVATGDDRWARVIDRCLSWFLGANDGAAVMVEPSTGAGYDGLEAHGANRNRGAESTIAWLSTVQVAQLPLPAGTR